MSSVVVWPIQSFISKSFQSCGKKQIAAEAQNSEYVHCLLRHEFESR